MKCTGCGQHWEVERTRSSASKVAPVVRHVGSYLGDASYVFNRAFDWLAGRSAKATMEATEAQRFAGVPDERICQQCDRPLCLDCLPPGVRVCAQCQAQATAEQAAPRGTALAIGPRCPSCGEPKAGSRFCSECGFDWAALRKTCPACGTDVARQSQFCPDCGHGF